MGGRNDLRQAIKTGDKEKILEILQEGVVDLKTITDIHGNKALHLAFESKASTEDQLIEILEVLLNHGCNINFKNKEGKTVLHLAVERRMTDIIDFCLKRNADPNLKNRKLNTIAHFIIEEEFRKFQSIVQKHRNIDAEEKLSSSFVDWMVSREIDFFNNRNKNRESALDLTIKLNLQHILVTLLKHVRDLRAIQKDQTHVLCSFLESNGNFNLRFNQHHHQALNQIESRFYKFRYVYDVVRIILEKDKLINDETLVTALRTAICSDQKMSVIKILLQRTTSIVNGVNGESLLNTFTDKCTWKYESQTEDCMEILRTLVIKGANINEYENNCGVTIALKWFRRCTNLKMLQLLKDCEADFSVCKDSNENFLQLVSQYGDEEGMIDLLTREGCDVNVFNNQGEMPLHIAIANSNVFVAKDLIEHCSNVNVMNSKGQTPLSLACEKGQSLVVEKLIQRGADLRYKDEYGNTLLHLTFESCTVDLLVKNGVEVNAKNNDGQTPIFCATESLAVKILFTAGARVDVVDNKSFSPLYFAVDRGQSNTFSELLKSGADIFEAKVFQRIADHLLDMYPHTCSAYFMNMDLIQHLVKLKAAKFLDEKFHIHTRYDGLLQKHFEECLIEIESLKKFFVDDLTSIYSLLHKKRNRRSAYADNEKLKNLVEDEKLSEQFPNYFVLILGSYNEAVARKSYLHKSICILENLTKANLPELCTDKIFEYLSNIDLLRLIETCDENINSSTLQEF